MSSSTKMLQTLKARIENMPVYHQIEILRIFQENDILLNENNNGTFINLTELESGIIEKLEKYISYVNEQESQLNEVEDEKSRIQNTFFKDNKDNTITN
jgi:signal-transduction protein with cAMP-binding, CBS, and nucleotidyltransferase domain|tara:strand:- start:6549 stop:6845 length:297 start_codon:yes stop_codon:yes gene_type:complete